MINRVLIRLKVIQVVYAYYQNGGKNLDATEKELFYSLSKAYELYKYLLALMIEVTQFADRRIDNRRHKLRPTEEDLNPNTRFIDNAFTAEERKWIKLVTNTNPDYDYDDFLGSSGSVPGGSDTEDRIFLLSSDEYDKYFPTIKSRIVSPTAYAIDSRSSERKDIYVCQVTCSSDNDCSASNCNNTGENVSLCSNTQCTSYVWLRSPGLFPDKPVGIIGIAGMSVGGLVHNDFPGLRPALYVRLSSER